MAKRAKKQGDITIRCKSLCRTEINDLHDFLKSREGVTHIFTRVSTMDAACDPSIHPKLTTIVALSVGIGGWVTREVAIDWFKDWLKNRRTQNAAEITVIYDAHKRIVRRVKRAPLPKAK